MSLEFDLLRSEATVELGILTLPEVGPPPSDARIGVRLFPTGRIAASLENAEGRLLGFGIEHLSEVAATFQDQPLYGWEFFDPPDSNMGWLGRLSVDFRTGTAGMTHTLHLFLEDAEQRFDLCFWFDELEILAPQGPLSLDSFIANGKRWWDGLHAGDPRTAGSGIQPLKKT